MRLALLASFVCAATGCGGLGSHDIELTVTSPAALSDTIVASVRSLEVGAGTGAHGGSMTIPLGRPLSRTERLTVHVSNDQGTVAVGVIAHDAGGAFVALGTGEVKLDGTGPKTLNVSLGAASAGDEVVHVSPASSALFVGDTLPLSADSDVTWSVDEPDGGTVDGSGVYTAPSTPGTYHVRASSSAFFGHAASATIAVVDTGIVPFVGMLGGPGYNDGPPGVGRLVGVSSMTVDGNTAYFGTQDKFVRALDLKTGNLATIAGTIDAPAPIDGTGKAAHFSDMTGIVADGLGHLYVADGFNYAIRKIDIATGKVTTFAGTIGMFGFVDGAPGTAQLGMVGGIAFDGAGTLYFSDNNCRIGKVDIATQTVSTVLGRMPGSPGGNCTESDGTGSAAGFAATGYSLVWDGAGHLYTTDPTRCAASTSRRARSRPSRPRFHGRGAWDGHQLDVINGNITRVNDDGTYANVKDGAHANQDIYVFGGYGSAFASDGSLYVGGQETIDRVDLAAGTRSSVAGFRLDAASQLDVRRSPADPAQRAQQLRGRARRNDLRQGVRLLLQGRSRQQQGGQAALDTTWYSCCAGLVADNNGNLYATGYDNTVRRIALADGGTLLAGAANMPGYKEGVGSAAQFNNLGDLALDGAGNLYVADSQNQLIRKIVLATGQTSAFAGTPQMFGWLDATGTAAQLNYPRGLVYDGAGALYVADSNNQRIRKVTVPGAIVTTVAGSGMFGLTDGAAAGAQFENPTTLAFDTSKQNLIVADTFNNSLRKVSLGSATVSTVAGMVRAVVRQPRPLPGVLNQPDMMGLLPSVSFLVGARRECAILQVRLP